MPVVDDAANALPGRVYTYDGAMADAPQEKSCLVGSDQIQESPKWTETPVVSFSQVSAKGC
jgi:hypothetical protein